MSLKSVISEDIENVFFNTDEISDEAIIDGKPVPIILDNDSLNGKSEIYTQGLAEGEQLIFIKEKDLLRLPKPGERITIGKEQWYVRHVITNSGVYECRVGRNQRK
jgi:hypothetical protein